MAPTPTRPRRRSSTPTPYAGFRSYRPPSNPLAGTWPSRSRRTKHNAKARSVPKLSLPAESRDFDFGMGKGMASRPSRGRPSCRLGECQKGTFTRAAHSEDRCLFRKLEPTPLIRPARPVKCFRYLLLVLLALELRKGADASLTCGEIRGADGA